jgi:hypothetical protein
VESVLARSVDGAHYDPVAVLRSIDDHKVALLVPCAIAFILNYALNTWFVARAPARPPAESGHFPRSEVFLGT